MPLVYLSVRLMPDIHPASVTLEGPMKLTLMVWFVPVFMLAAGLIVVRFRLDERLAESQQRGFEVIPPATGKFKFGTAALKRDAVKRSLKRA